MNIKQVILMRTDLNMRKGKMIAQGSHASMKVFFDRGSTGFTWRSGQQGLLFETDDEDGNSGDAAMLIHLDAAMKEWAEGLFTKICVQVGSEAELLDLVVKAEAACLPCALIQDAGLTEFGGVKTYTCAAIGPAPAELIDPITGGLKLL